MPIDKSWIDSPLQSAHYQQGLKSFIAMCERVLPNHNEVRCPCSKCKCSGLTTITKMKLHLGRMVFWKDYIKWDYHGEKSRPAVVEVDNVVPQEGMENVIEDIRGERMEEDTDRNLEMSGGESNGVDDDFEDIIKDVESELYPGCTKFSSLDFLAKLMNLKETSHWTNTSFDGLLKILQESMPVGNKIPPTHYVVKKKFKKIGLDYEMIDACVNDCALFWKEHESLQNCPVCRWVDKDTKGTKVARKVLRYFPLTPRLRRLYCSRHTAKDMIWHSTGRSEDGTMRHPVDGSSWQDFDRKFPNFAMEPRNVRLGLAADGFNPFNGNGPSTHSTWPVILTTYNLPPWLCMRESTFMLTLLIPGPKSPGKDMDIYLRPLVDELKHLWHSGVRTKDATTNEFFTMKAALLWTINDFPARSSLSGWSGQGYMACPTCNEDTPSMRVTGKCVYVGHRRFLDANHPWRTSLDFNGRPETRGPPRQFSPADIEAQHGRLLHRLPGKHPSFGGGRISRADFELNWTKRSIFFELEYWSFLQLKHNLDVMHIEKNVCDSLLGTLLMNEKTKDTPNARNDLQKLNIRPTQWLKQSGSKFLSPHPKYSFKSDDRKLFCEFIKNVKLPDGFGSNISKRVTDNNSNITGLKSHDCHILMQRLIPIGVRGLLTKDTSTPMVDLCMFFKQLCSRTLLVEDMRKAKDDILTILCKLEIIYPPAFFDIMVHLLVHLPDEAIAGGPVAFRWMYPFERYMKKLKKYVRNPTRPEGCIAEGYVLEEALTFCSMYLQDVQTKFNRPDRNEDVVVEKCKFWVFESKCRPTSATKSKYLSTTEKSKMEWFVLDNCAEVREYMNEFISTHPQDDLKTKFPEWFLNKVHSMKTQNSPEFHPELYALSIGAKINAETYAGCIVNGVRFMTLERDAKRATQNSGVEVVGENGVKFYGQLEEIIKLNYTNGYSTVLFRCKWFDTRRGEYVSTLFQSPAFINQLESFLAARGKQVAPDDEYDDEYDDDDLT
ncbi:uncharacterized protein LOC110942563 [Helianthus annuus]|uniref:uncharacterized protein LOC110942563 n=1 Tax=Helianthus annuus TaxID=4232 RepID=UPI000B904549|nr:uncharacterized protein LOC110942563 [Helianthus annuus]